MAAHQPLFFPYLGYFDRMKRCDIFVIRDDTQFAKRNFHHRNRIRVPNAGGEPKLKWLTVPVDKSPVPLAQVKINNQVRLKNRTWQQDLECQLNGCYASAPYYKEFAPRIIEILKAGHEGLVDLNMALLRQFCHWFEVDTKIVLATELSDFTATGDATEDLVEITRATKCSTYLSGDGAKIYIRPEPFEEAKLNLTFQQYSHPVYDQSGQEFVPYLACLDVLFHTGSYSGD